MEASLLCTVVFFAFHIAILLSTSNGHILHRRADHRYRRPPLSSLSEPTPSSYAEGPGFFFEVSRPVGDSSSACSSLVLQHAFAYTYDLPPAVANYTPPPQCRTPWSQIVLKWSGTCKGRQYDRIAAVWFGGVEVLRTCTAEPTSSGIYWEVRKDVTRFASVFKQPQLVVVELANVVDSTYTGIFNINVTLEFYSSKRHEILNEHQRHMGRPDERRMRHIRLPQSHDGNPSKASSDLSSPGGLLDRKFSETGSATSDADVKLFLDALQFGDGIDEAAGDGLRKGARLIESAREGRSLDFPSNSPADVVIPISKENGFSGGHWFDLATENETGSTTFTPPRNIIRAVLEICVSFHGTDEFWYSNPPNEYLEANGLTGYPGNGPFREVQVLLDDVVVGAVCPFPVIFTGGINPLYWRPAAAIGAYNLPSYDVELTPFAGSLVDGSNHTISMRVTNADGSWPLDANLHLWLDPYTSQTIGGLLSHSAPLVTYNTVSDFEGLEGIFQTKAARVIAYSGYIISSLGTILTSASYKYLFENQIIFQNGSAVEIVTQEVQTKGEVTARTSSKVVFSQETSGIFPFYLSCADYSGTSNVYTEECNLTHSFDQDVFTISSSTSNFESLKNSQAATGSMTVVGSSVTAGIGALQHHYGFQSTQGCYDRFLSTRNYSILSDITNLSCEHYGRMDA